MIDKDLITSGFVDSLLDSKMSIAQPYIIGTGIFANSITSNTISNTTWYTSTRGQEWIDDFPEWRTIQEMAIIYPAIAVAVKNLQTTYTLVKDDFTNRKKLK